MQRGKKLNEKMAEYFVDNCYCFIGHCQFDLYSFRYWHENKIFGVVKMNVETILGLLLGAIIGTVIRNWRWKK